MGKDLALALKGGTVIDGSRQPRFRADLGIRDNRIVAIARDTELQAVEEIDCRGLIVAPGFIDTHSHSDLKVLNDPALPMKVRQGITLEIFGQDGISVAPVHNNHKPHLERQLAGLLGRLGREWEWQSTAEYLAALEHRQPGVDCAYLIPHGALRLSVMGMEDRHSTPAERELMCALLEQGMREGAFGLSTGLIYPPCCYSDTGELIDLCRKVATLNGCFVVHMRSESDYLEAAVDEMIEVARASGVHVHISHFKAAGRENWVQMDSVLAKIEAAHTAGLRITADQYPYIAGSTMMGAILPPWAHAGGTNATLEKLADTEQRRRMRAQITTNERAEWDNFWKWSGPEGIIISDIPSGNNQDVLGKSVAAAAQLYGKDPVEFAFDLLLEERMGVSMISFSQSEEIVQKILRLAYVNACTDGLLGARPHPRAFGTYPRILGRYVRELSILTLEEAVYKLSYLAAQTFGLKDYGLIKEGYIANLVVFDADQVIDQATFEDPCRYPIGIPHVIVQGVPVIKDNVEQSKFPGKVVRKSL
ncbi:MAG: D-aminoacylase [Acidobacteriota bacterium]